MEISIECALRKVVCIVITVFVFVMGDCKWATAAVENNVSLSWGDTVYEYGPGTDSAMDSNSTIQNMINRWKGRGYKGVYWRTELAQLEPNAIIWNMVSPGMAYSVNYINKRASSNLLGRARTIACLL